MNEAKIKKYNLIGDGLPLGCKVIDGKIVPALSEGWLYTNSPKSATYVQFINNCERFFAINSEGVYTYVEGNQFVFIGLIKAKRPFTIEYKNGTESVSNLVLDEKTIYVNDVGRYLFDFTQNVGGGVYKNGRVFALDLSNPLKLRWSGEGGINDWEEKLYGAGWMCPDTEKGEIYNMLVFKDKIALVRQFGINLICVSGSPDEFKEGVSVAIPTPYKNCATVCGNKLYVYTVNGLYSFDGTEAEKVPVKLAENFTTGKYAMTHGSCVFFTGTHSTLRRKVIFVYDTIEKSSYFIDLPATALGAGKEAYAFTNEGTIKLTKGTKFTYESAEIGHFSKRQKTLKSVFIDCAKGVDLTVTSDRGSRLFEDVKGEINTNFSGSYFKLSVLGTNSEIKEFYAEVECC